MAHKTACRACGKLFTPRSVYVPSGYCSMDCWCERLNQPTGKKQGTTENRPGNTDPNAGGEFSNAIPPRSFPQRIGEYMTLMGGYENINNK